MAAAVVDSEATKFHHEHLELLPDERAAAGRVMGEGAWGVD